jgi:effector-binding domain-containing protein
VLDSPRIVTTSARPYAALRLTIPKAAIQTEMGPGLREVQAALARQGVPPAGPWFTHHLCIDPRVWDFEIGVPVAGPIAAAGRVTACEWPAMTVAQGALHGGYEGLAAAWAELDAWVAAQKLSPLSDLWEVYSVGPEASVDPSAWRTELNRPLRRR